jgi:outer membrane receptor protein involved in Fe transport
MERTTPPSGAARRNVSRVLLTTAIAGCLLAATPAAISQTSSATLRGQVTAAEAAPAGNAKVTATNTQTGLTRSVVSDANGNYSLAGLPPGTYKVDVNADGQSSSQVVVLQVGQTATLDLGIGEQVAARDVESVTVTATQLYETKTSEVASYVSTRQIEMLPQNSRNFLAFADTIPGVQFSTNGTDGSSELRSGAQSSNGVNVFIDGVGQKNYVLRGGVSGQALSRGNPFPQLGIAEYKVITSNYKAEFDQLSSAAVVAVTRSGTNEFEGEGFWDRTAENWRASDPIEARAGRKSASEQKQYGMAFGGPIIKDRMHFFVTYEKKEVESPRTIRFGQSISSTAPALANFAQYLGPTSSPFDEDLFFGKIDWSVGDFHLLEFTAKLRDESEIQEIGDANTASYATSKDNKETRLDLRYQFSGASWLNDAHITYEEAELNPRPVSIAPGYQLTTGNPNQVILNLGGGRNFQDKGQKGYAFQDDLTFSDFEWHGAHTVKTGLKYKLVDLNAFEQQPYNAQFAYDINTSLTVPFQVQFGAALRGVPDRTVESRNKQFGIYLQDDWEVNDRLLVNLGVRWDYEETPGYLDYVTPAYVLAGLNAVDTRPGAAAGQTYVQTLANGGIDINDYISTGNNRDAFTDAIQPRVGFSYDLGEDQRHVVFGGAGRAYDRNVFDYLALERSKATFPSYTFRFDTPGHACTLGVDNCIAWNEAYFDRANLEALVAANPALGGEVNMIHNDLKTPYSDQFSLGIRNRIMLWNVDWNTSATISHIVSKDGVVFLLGNRRPNGAFRSDPNSIWGDQPWSFGIPGLGTLVIAKNGLETKANSLLLSAEKAYSRESGWSMTLAYTYTDGEENRTNLGLRDEHSIFDYPDVAGFGWHTSTGVSRHRFVGTGTFDAPWGIALSGKLTLSSPVEIEAINCLEVTAAGQCYFQNFKPDTTIGYKQFDLAAQKTFDTWSDFSVRLRADVLNVFNSDNVDNDDTYRGDLGAPNAAYGRRTSYFQPTRTFKLSFAVNWQ